MNRSSTIVAAEPAEVRASPELHAYFTFHRLRYGVLLSTCDDLITPGQTSPAILDVGPFIQTALIRDRYPRIRVDTMGFGDERFVGRGGEAHFEVDLNRPPGTTTEPSSTYDVVVLAEVLEHLRVSPVATLHRLGSYLAPGGHLVVQTPNACAVHKRLAMLVGRNPFQIIEGDDAMAGDLGHIREFTVDELVTLGARAGLDVRSWLTANYFDAGGLQHRIFTAIGRGLPPRLRDGITIDYRRAAAPPVSAK
jgi:trans-aconitate methyltransferase